MFTLVADIYERVHKVISAYLQSRTKVNGTPVFLSKFEKKSCFFLNKLEKYPPAPQQMHLYFCVSLPVF